MPTNGQARLIRQILTGQKVTTGPGNKQQSNLITQILTGQPIGGPSKIGGGLGGLAAKSLAASAHLGVNAPLGTNPDNGQPLGAGLNGDPLAPPVMSSAKHPASHKTNTQQMLNQAAIAAISAQFDPQIGVLGKQIARTKHEGASARHRIARRGNQAVGDLAYLYGGLGRDVGATRRAGRKDYRQAIQGTRDSFHQLGHMVNTDYSTNIGSTAKELQRLGIDPTQALSGTAKDQAFLNAERAQQRVGAVNNLRSSKREYSNNMKQLKHDVILSGLGSIATSKDMTQSSLTDLAKSVGDNIFQLRMQRAGLQGQESAAVAAQHLAATQARAAAHSPDARLARQYKQAQIAHMLGLTPTGASAAAQVPKDNIGKGLSFLESNASSEQHPLALENILNYVYANGAGPSSSKAPWDKKNITPIWQALVKTGQRHKWTVADMNYLQRALQIAMG